MQLGSGLEALIAFQKTRPLFIPLTAEIDALKATMAADGVIKITTELLQATKIPALLQEGTGFEKITLLADPDSPINAFTNAITLSDNHTFLDKWRKLYGGHGDALNLYRKADDVLKGQVDLETGKVSGDFSKIPITIGLGNEMLNPKHGFLSEEIAAFLLHEAGHDVTYCYALHYTCTINMVLALAVKAIVNAGETKQKHAIMTDIENRIGIRISNQAELVAYDKYENYYITLLGQVREKNYDALGAGSYDSNMSEQMADMFAARHGAAKYIVTGLARMHRIFKPSLARKIKYNVAGLIAFVAFAPITIPVFIASVATNDFIAGTYDLTKDRFIRMRNETIFALKDTSLTSGQKELLLKELEVIDKIVAATSNEWSVAEKLALLTRSSQRAQFREKRLQQELEAMINNPLYSAAAKYSL